MTAKILNYILSFTKLGTFLKDHQLAIGAVLILLAKILEGLQAAAPMLPDLAFLGQAESGLREGLNAVVETLGTLGYSFAGVGLANKYVDAKLPDSKK